MAATKGQINWTAVSHGSTGITRVTAASFGQGGKLVKFKGDVDNYPTIIANVDNEPHASITTSDPAILMGLSPGADATLTATLQDAKLAAGGAIVFSMAHAVFENADTQGQHAQFASATGTFQAYSSDGSTNPLSFSRT